MTYIQQILTRNPATETYPRALAHAYKLFRVPDPSFAVNQEINIESKIMLDADLKHSLTFRWRSIAGTRYMVAPPDNATAAEIEMAETETDLVNSARRMRESVMNLARADLSGARYAQIRYSVKDVTHGEKSRRWAYPRVLVDAVKEQFRQVTNQYDRGASIGQRLSVYLEMFDLNTDTWKRVDDRWRFIGHKFMDSQEMLGYGRGLRDALFYIWYSKSQLLAAMNEASERFGRGYVNVGVDGMRDSDTGAPNPQAVAEWLSALKRMRENGAFVRDKKDELTMLETSGTGWKLMTDLWYLLNQSADRLILGATLPTGGGDSAVGSLARASVEQSSTSSIISACRASLEDTLDHELLGSIRRVNHANYCELGWDKIRTGKFKIEFDVEEVQKPAEQRVREALESGAPVLKSEFYEAFSLTQPEDGDDVITGEDKRNHAPVPLNAFSAESIRAFSESLGEPVGAES